MFRLVRTSDPVGRGWKGEGEVGFIISVNQS